MSRIYCSRFPLLINTTTHQNYKGMEREQRQNYSPKNEEMKSRDEISFEFCYLIRVVLHTQ